MVEISNTTFYTPPPRLLPPPPPPPDFLPSDFILLGVPGVGNKPKNEIKIQNFPHNMGIKPKILHLQRRPTLVKHDQLILYVNNKISAKSMHLWGNKAYPKPKTSIEHLCESNDILVRSARVTSASPTGQLGAFGSIPVISGIYIFDFDRFFSDFDQKVMEIMPILPIYCSNFGQMGICIDGVAPP